MGHLYEKFNESKKFTSHQDRILEEKKAQSSNFNSLLKIEMPNSDDIKQKQNTFKTRTDDILAIEKEYGDKIIILKEELKSHQKIIESKNLEDSFNKSKIYSQISKLKTKIGKFESEKMLKLAAIDSGWTERKMAAIEKEWIGNETKSIDKSKTDRILKICFQSSDKKDLIKK